LWLPKAHVEAPAGGSIILAGVILKLGGYGLIRIFIFVYRYVKDYNYIFICLRLFGSLYIRIICLFQRDLKILIAYSSISHIGLVIRGLFTLRYYGFLGGYFLILRHGLISSGLFFFIGCLYDRFGTRSFFILKGLMNFIPSFSFFFFLFCGFNISCPPRLRLLSEFLIVIRLIR
jgi:NADH:ubiquinone oxidoreductase subunit 4 (subunit M)